MRKCKKVVQNMFSDIQPNTRKYFRSIFKYATKHLKIIYFSKNVFPPENIFHQTNFHNNFLISSIQDTTYYHYYYFFGSK